MITVRPANCDDVVAMAQVDSRCWPAELALTVDQYQARVEIYAPGQLVAVADDHIIGVSSSQRVTTSLLEQHGDQYDRITDQGCIRRTHRVKGEIYQLIHVGVLPEARGRRLGRQLVDAQITFARSIASVRRIVGVTRPAGFHRSTGLTIDEYLNRPPEDPDSDAVVAFHLLAGARVVSIHANFRPADVEACGYGILIEYPRTSTSCAR